MAKSPNWNKNELQILENNYPHLGSGPSMCSMLPGRTSKSINVKASRLGLKILFDRQWTEDENSILANLYPQFGSDKPTIEALINRSAESIRIHAARLGIKCNKLDGKIKPIEVYLEELNIIGVTLLGNYTGSKDKILHRCNKCLHEWYPTPNNLVQGSGCPNCSHKFKYKYSLGYLYLININNEFLKVGITSRPISYRLMEISRELEIPYTSIILISIKECQGDKILSIENSILNNPRLNRYTHNIKFSGYTELFNISELDKLQSIFNEII